jgi:nucleoside-diphosphate-sugar epimerase
MMTDTFISSIASDLDSIMLRLGDKWEGLRNKSIFITGGTGFFGRWLLESLVQANRQLGLNLRVTVLTRNEILFLQGAPHLARDAAIRFHVGDVRDFAYPDGDFTHVIHAATTSAHETFNGATPLSKFDTLVTGTRRTLDFAAQRGVEQFLFTSSGAAYALPFGNRALCEDDAAAPDTTDTNSGLGQAKRAAEFLCSAYAQQQGWNLTIARCFSFVGPFMPLDIHYAIGNFIRQARRGEPIVVKGDGLPIRSYLYSADLVVWLLTLLQRTGAPKIYNVGSDERIGIGELAALVRDTLNPAGEVRVLGQADYSVGNPVRNCYVPDIARARNEFGLDVWTPLRESILSTGRCLAER